MAVAARALGVVGQTLYSWSRQSAKGLTVKVKGSVELMEIS